MSRTVARAARYLRRVEAARAHEKGLRAEAAVLTALRRPSAPWWILGVRAATEAEDRSGIDVVVEAVDCGRLFLQVKSSPRGRRRWRREHRGDPRPIGVVVVPEGACLEVAYGRALGALILLRERSTLLAR